MATRRRGTNMRRLGKTGAGDEPDFVSNRRYMYPVRAAKRDWTVLRKTGNLNFSGLATSP